MNEEAKDMIDTLSSEQVDFVCRETGKKKEELYFLSDNELDELYDSMCDIEIDEAVKADNEGRDISPRGEMAADIVTAWGNI